MPSIFHAIAPAELDPTLQRGYNYQISRAAELKIAAALEGAPRQHLLAAANKAEQSARELAMEQPILAAFAKGDQVAIDTIEGTLPNGVRVTSLTPVAVGKNPNSHSLTTASFASTHKNQAMASEAFWRTTEKVATRTTQLPDSLPARIASEAITFVAKACLGINFRPGATETTVWPCDDTINKEAGLALQRVSQPIAVHLENVATRNFRQNRSPKLLAAIDIEIAEIEVRAQTEAAAAERQAFFEAATIDEARSAATTVEHGPDGTITTTVGVEALEEYQAALMAMRGY